MIAGLTIDFSVDNRKCLAIELHSNAERLRVRRAKPLSADGLRCCSSQKFSHHQIGARQEIQTEQRHGNRALKDSFQLLYQRVPRLSRGFIQQPLIILQLGSKTLLRRLNSRGTGLQQMTLL
jgi:hypothetical protein